MSHFTESRSKWLNRKYEILGPAGHGGMANVFRALTHGEAGFHRKVAVKRILPNLSRDPEFAAMFVEEARVVAELEHPNIVQIHDFCRDEEGDLFIVMEWIEGVGLDSYLYAYNANGMHAPWQYVVAIAIEVLRALMSAHERRDDRGDEQPVFHRDISQSNILIGMNGVVKLADFGLARATDRPKMTKPGIVKGRVAYHPPEILRGAKASAKTDIWGTGIVLWESLASRRAYGPGTLMEIAERVLRGTFPPIDELRQDLPPELVGAVHSATERDPNKRIDCAEALMRALSRVLRDQPHPTDAKPLGRSVTKAVELLKDTPPQPEAAV